MYPTDLQPGALELPGFKPSKHVAMEVSWQIWLNVLPARELMSQTEMKFRITVRRAHHVSGTGGPIRCKAVVRLMSMRPARSIVRTNPTFHVECFDESVLNPLR